MALYDISRYQVVWNESDGKWKVQTGSGSVVSSHRKKSAAVSEAKRLGRNKGERTNDAVRVEIYKKSGQSQRTIDITRKR